MYYQFYKTQHNDRWDKIAYKFYGNVFNQQMIIEANPDVDILPVLDAGITLIIPIPDKTEDNFSEELPIWKR